MEVKAEGNAQIPLTRIDQVGLRSLLKTWERRAGKKKIAGLLYAKQLESNEEVSYLRQKRQIENILF